MSEQISIMHLFSSSGIGGTEIVSSQAISNMDHAEFRHDAIFTDSRNQVTEYYRPLVRKLEILGEGPMNKRISKVSSIASELKPDVVFAYGFTANSMWRICRFTSKLCRAAGYVMVLGSIYPMANPTRVRILIDRLTTGAVDVVMANTHAGLKNLERLGYRLPKTVVAHNGIDSSVYSPAENKRDARKRIGLPQDVPVVMCVANNRTPKNHPLLLDAFAIVKREFGSAVLALVGKGLEPGSGALVDDISRLQLGDSVKFIGTRHDIPKVLHAADVFALTSSWEGLPGAVQEAMASGLPVVATAVGGVPELIEDGVSGRLADSEDAESVARGIIEYLSDSELAERTGAAARQKMIDEFSFRNMAAKWELAAKMAAGR
jgi:glycosyltransferase involved in cell wall biosynthesis